jgi:hypothetical protein
MIVTPSKDRQSLVKLKGSGLFGGDIHGLVGISFSSRDYQGAHLPRQAHFQLELHPQLTSL